MEKHNMMPPPPPTEDTIPKKYFRIWVIDNRFVEVGYGQRINDPVLGECVLLTECHNVRVWGTDKGLSQLSVEGIQPNTKLDKSRPSTIPLSRIVKSIEIPKNLIDDFL